MTRWDWKEIAPHVYVAGDKRLHGSIWGEFSPMGLVQIGWDVTAEDGRTVGSGWIDVQSSSQGGIRRAKQTAMERASFFAYGYRSGLRDGAR